MAKGFKTGLILGGILGAVAGFLLAPRPGEETREQLRERAEEFLRMAGGEPGLFASEAAERVGELTLLAREKADEFVTRQRMVIEEAVEEGKAAAARKTAELQTRLQQARGEEQNV